MIHSSQPKHFPPIPISMGKLRALNVYVLKPEPVLKGLTALLALSSKTGKTLFVARDDSTALHFEKVTDTRRVGCVNLSKTTPTVVSLMYVRAKIGHATCSRAEECSDHLRYALQNTASTSTMWYFWPTAEEVLSPTRLFHLQPRKGTHQDTGASSYVAPRAVWYFKNSHTRESATNKIWSVLFHNREDVQPQPRHTPFPKEKKKRRFAAYPRFRNRLQGNQSLECVHMVGAKGKGCHPFVRLHG